MIKKYVVGLAKIFEKISSKVELNLGIKRKITTLIPKTIIEKIDSLLVSTHDINTHHYTFRPRHEPSYDPKKNLSQFTKLFDLEINKITNVVTKKYGVSDKNGKYFLYGNKRNGGDTRLSKLPQKNGKKPSEEVEVFTLDHIVKDWDVNFDIVKIDTQGMDFQCMLGASDFLQNNPNCSFVIEFVKSMPNMEPLHKPYRPYDFCAFLFDKFDSIYNIDQSMYMSYKQLKKFAKQGTGEIDLWCRNDK